MIVTIGKTGAKGVPGCPKLIAKERAECYDVSAGRNLPNQ
jgi:hypothetical protein